MAHPESGRWDNPGGDGSITVSCDSAPTPITSSRAWTEAPRLRPKYITAMPDFPSRRAGAESHLLDQSNFLDYPARQ